MCFLFLIKFSGILNIIITYRKTLGDKMTIKIKNTDKMSEKDRINYIRLLVRGQLETEKDSLALMSNISAIIKAVLPRLNWVGFYLLKNDQLVLGPFQGLPACTRLNKDKGVCAKAWRESRAIRVDDVNSFEGHVACDEASQSELVIPLFKDGIFYGVLDLDSPEKNRFTDIEEGLIEISKLIEEYIIEDRI